MSILGSIFSKTKVQIPLKVDLEVTDIYHFNPNAILEEAFTQGSISKNQS